MRLTLSGARSTFRLNHVTCSVDRDDSSVRCCADSMNRTFRNRTFRYPQFLPATVRSLGSLGSAGCQHPDRDRGSENVLRRRRRIIYDARESSSPVSDSEAIEKYEENRPGARERHRTSTVNLSPFKVLAWWDFLSYPESYPSQSRAGVRPHGIGWARMSRLSTF